MKILFVSHTANWAGAEVGLHTLLLGLDPSRHEPLVVLPGHGRLQTKLADLGVPFEYGSLVPWIDRAVTTSWTRFGDDLTRRVEAMARRIERARCDLVFTNTSVVVEGALAARMVGVPHIWRVHEMLSRHTNLGTRLSLDTYHGLLDSASERVAVVSKSVRAELVPFVRPEMIHVIENGVDRFDGSDVTRAALLGVLASTPVIVFVGTISDAKGAPLLAPIMERVAARVRGAVLVIVGEDAGAESALRRTIEKRGLERSFRFLGFRRDAMDVIANADVLVLPSWVDSLPSVVMEAMAAGVPCVATRSGGAEELIVEGETGRLVPPGDVEAIARALEELLLNESSRRAMGERARARARARFPRERYVGAFEQLFDQVLASGHAHWPLGAVPRLLGLLEAVSKERASSSESRALEDLLRELRVTRTAASPRSAPDGDR